MTGSGLEELRIFITVVREQGFAAAGRYLNLPPSTVSRKVTLLEERLNCRLLERTTRRLRLTDAGREYFQHCASALDLIDDASRELQQSNRYPRGLLRICAPANLAGSYLAPCLALFMEQWPDIRFDVQLNNNPPSFLDQTIDVAFIGGELPESDLIAQPLGVLHFGLFASEQYLQKHGYPQHPDDLAGHSLITCWPLREWRLKTDTGNKITLHPRARMHVDGMSTALRVAREGLGIVNLPASYIALEQGDDTFVPVLPDWHGAKRKISIVYRSRELLPQRVRLFIDFIREQMQKLMNQS
ncbi:LysR family transcriptional regulator [Sansalvadorimonas sp. 2012CJ34-2]|uniref:LysR family transcriptional regulator n=1 Tax=Parendozoicomonas callyspongiae TaxID=2942213 RepID=A0ABT0PE62_9GAMM|nr:LysR family transcriptional regulator [Sansalvadorimonas sp. 2012CJ34-2]MCL6269674.1 LysR family transcriptional regulator [Sansalvadorimonas sp. 2012CJ34-2]